MSRRSSRKRESPDGGVDDDGRGPKRQRREREAIAWDAVLCSRDDILQWEHSFFLAVTDPNGRKRALSMLDAPLGSVDAATVPSILMSRLGESATRAERAATAGGARDPPLTALEWKAAQLVGKFVVQRTLSLNDIERSVMTNVAAAMGEGWIGAIFWKLLRTLLNAPHQAYELGEVSVEATTCPICLTPDLTRMIRCAANDVHGICGACVRAAPQRYHMCPICRGPFFDISLKFEWIWNLFYSTQPVFACQLLAAALREGSRTHSETAPTPPVIFSRVVLHLVRTALGLRERTPRVAFLSVENPDNLDTVSVVRPLTRGPETRAALDACAAVVTLYHDWDVQEWWNRNIIMVLCKVATYMVAAKRQLKKDRPMSLREGNAAWADAYHAATRMARAQVLYHRLPWIMADLTAFEPSTMTTIHRNVLEFLDTHVPTEMLWIRASSLVHTVNACAKAVVVEWKSHGNIVPPSEILKLRSVYPYVPSIVNLVKRMGARQTHIQSLLSLVTQAEMSILHADNFTEELKDVANGFRSHADLAVGVVAGMFRLCMLWEKRDAVCPNTFRSYLTTSGYVCDFTDIISNLEQQRQVALRELHDTVGQFSSAAIGARLSMDLLNTETSILARSPWPNSLRHIQAREAELQRPDWENNTNNPRRQTRGYAAVEGAGAGGASRGPVSVPSVMRLLHSVRDYADDIAVPITTPHMSPPFALHPQWTTPRQGVFVSGVWHIQGKLPSLQQWAKFMPLSLFAKGASDQGGADELASPSTAAPATPLRRKPILYTLLQSLPSDTVLASMGSSTAEGLLRIKEWEAKADTLNEAGKKLLQLLLNSCSLS